MASLDFIDANGDEYGYFQCDSNYAACTHVRSKTQRILELYRWAHARSIIGGSRGIFGQAEMSHQSSLPAERNQKKKEKLQAYQNAERKQLRNRKVGQVVFARDPNRQQKWDAMYEGPYSMVGKDGRGAYVLREPSGSLVGRHFSLDQLNVVKREEAEFAFVIEKIIHRHGEGSCREYLVKWKHLPENRATWEPIEHFNDWKCIQSYWKTIGSSDKVACVG